MIIKIRIPQVLESAVQERRLIIRSRDSSAAYYIADILEVIPELTEKEKVLSQLFGLNITSEFKEVLAKLVNKAYEA